MSKYTKKGKKVKKIVKKKNGVYKIHWSVLSEFKPKMKKLTPNLKKIINKRVQMEGYMIPLDYTAKRVKEFLFVSYWPECFHIPPPPLNQIVKVKMKGNKSIIPKFEVRITGKLTFSKSANSKKANYMEGIYNIISDNVEEIGQ